MNLISWRMDDDNCISFWYDNWVAVGPLSALFSKQEIVRLCIPVEATMHLVFHGGTMESLLK